MRDDKVAKHLTDAGVEFEYREQVPVKSIHRDPLRSQFQARVISSPLSSDTVDMYAASMRHGDDFPAPVLAKRQDGTYDILGGFHRVNAMHRVGRVNTDAYVCSVSKVVADRIARTLNNLEAVQGATKAERIAQARRLMDLHGFSVATAAKDAGIGESTLEQEMRSLQTQHRLAETNVDLSRLSTAHLAEMAGVHNDNVLAALADVVSRARVGAMPLRPLITEVREARTEEAQISVVRSFEQSPLIQERLALVRTGRVRHYAVTRRSSTLFRAINTASNVLTKYPDPAVLGVTESELDQLRKDWEVLRRKMGDLLDSPAFARPDPEPTTVSESPVPSTV